MSCPICEGDNEVSYSDGTCTDCGNRKVQQSLDNNYSKEYIEVVNKNNMKKLGLPKKKKVTITQIKKKAWEQFSLYIRRKDAIGDMVRCVTCGRVKHYKEMQAGHFVPGRHSSVLFDERNVHPQDYTCNVLLGGNGPKYYKYMLSKYGQEVIDELEQLDSVNKQFKVYELEAIFEAYRDLNRQLLE